MHRILDFFARRVLALLMAGAFVPAWAQSPPAPIAPVSYATVVDLAAGIATFSIAFDRAPDLLTVDDFLRQADSFQFWTDTASTDPLGSTLAGITGAGPLGTQSVLTATDVPVTGQLTYIWPRDASYTGPRDSGGWGEVQGGASYTLGAGNTISFDVPLAILHAADGQFNYVFETYQYGAGGETDFFGVSGQAYQVGCVPEPSPALSLAGGMLVLAGAAMRRRRRRPPVCAAAEMNRQTSPDVARAGLNPP